MNIIRSLYYNIITKLKSGHSINYLDYLPNEIMLMIMSQLESQNLFSMRLTSKKWCYLIKDPSLAKKFTLLQQVVINRHPSVQLKNYNKLYISYISISRYEQCSGILRFIKKNGVLIAEEPSCYENNSKQLGSRGFYLSPLYHFAKGWNQKNKNTPAWDIFKRLVKGHPCGHFHLKKKEEIPPTDDCCIRLTPYPQGPQSKEGDRSDSPQDQDAPLPGQ